MASEGASIAAVLFDQGRFVDIQTSHQAIGFFLPYLEGIADKMRLEGSDVLVNFMDVDARIVVVRGHDVERHDPLLVAEAASAVFYQRSDDAIPLTGYGVDRSDDYKFRH